MFEKALNNANASDASALAQVIILATDPPVGTDQVFQTADRVYLQWLILNEIMSDKKVRSLKNIIDLIDQGPAEALRNVPEWTDATENFRKLVLAGVTMRLKEIYLAEEHLRSHR